jgi:hypothetical protein
MIVRVGTVANSCRESIRKESRNASTNHCCSGYRRVLLHSECLLRLQPGSPVTKDASSNPVEDAKKNGSEFSGKQVE